MPFFVKIAFIALLFCFENQTYTALRVYKLKDSE